MSMNLRGTCGAIESDKAIGKLTNWCDRLGSVTTWRAHAAGSGLESESFQKMTDTNTLVTYRNEQPARLWSAKISDSEPAWATQCEPAGRCPALLLLWLTAACIGDALQTLCRLCFLMWFFTGAFPGRRGRDWNVLTYDSRWVLVTRLCHCPTVTLHWSHRSFVACGQAARAGPGGASTS